ncbi:hypothetical protein pb186bvf_005535 [Paramecium bursaria]
MEDYEDNNEFLRESQQLDLEECTLCTRKFHPERIERHVIACEKALLKQKEREKKIQKKQKQLKKEEKAPEPQSNWREEHKQFQDIIKYNRKVKEMTANGEDTKAIQAPVTINSTYIYCDSCQRSFAPHVAETHIPKCREIISKPKPPTVRKNTSSTASTSSTQHPAVVKKLSGSTQQFRPRSLQKMMKTTDQILPDVKPNWTNIGFLDVQTRAIAIQDTECPFCSRKFVARAAERHIPICEKLTKKSMYQVKKNSLQKVKPSQLPQLKLIPKSSIPAQIGTSSFCTYCGNKFQPNHKYFLLIKKNKKKPLTFSSNIDFFQLQEKMRLINSFIMMTDPVPILTQNKDDYRKLSIQRYKQKKHNWAKKIQYLVRKQVADTRLRVGGKFVSIEQEKLILETQKVLGFKKVTTKKQNVRIHGIDNKHILSHLSQVSNIVDRIKTKKTIFKIM